MYWYAYRMTIFFYLFLRTVSIAFTFFTVFIKLACTTTACFFSLSFEIATRVTLTL